MHIYDLNGKRIEVTDLSKAIEQAKAFTGFQHEDENYQQLDNTLFEYWNDMLKKLETLNKQKR